MKRLAALVLVGALAGCGSSDPVSACRALGEYPTLEDEDARAWADRTAPTLQAAGQPVHGLGVELLGLTEAYLGVGDPEDGYQYVPKMRSTYGQIRAACAAAGIPIPKEDS